MNNFLYDVPIKINDDDYSHSNNVVKAAAKIFKKLKDNDEVITLAEMQSGKSEVMKRMLYIINNHNKQLQKFGIKITKYNIYVIICASSKNLKKQHMEKLPDIKNHIYHLNDIAIFLKKSLEYDILLTNMTRSSLIIFDECHCDAEHEKLIDKFRKTLNEIALSYNTHYYKVGFSATPYEQVLSKYPIVVMKPGRNYYGICQMFNIWKTHSYAAIFQSKKLTNIIECQELFSEIDICKCYYIFRLPSNKQESNAIIENISVEFKKRQKKYNSYIYDMDYHGNINDILAKEPCFPTIIYLKDKLRMGEYLNTEYVYLVHDDPSNTYAHTTAQSLLGRCCGYNKMGHGTIIYCDYEKAYEHYRWIKNNYSRDKIPHNAKYISKRSGKTKDICIY